MRYYFYLILTLLSIPNVFYGADNVQHIGCNIEDFSFISKVKQKHPDNFSSNLYEREKLRTWPKDDMRTIKLENGKLRLRHKQVLREKHTSALVKDIWLLKNKKFIFQVRGKASRDGIVALKVGFGHRDITGAGEDVVHQSGFLGLDKTTLNDVLQKGYDSRLDVPSKK